jgi:DNA-binding response OmpR family regulator
MSENLLDYFSVRGHSADAALDGLTAWRLATTHTYDAILLDRMLPGMDGLTLCRKLRQEAGCSLPILMLTARDTLEDKIAGLESGADDYLIKPFALREVEARLRALVRRAEGRVGQTRLQVADLVMDLSTLQVQRAGQFLSLTPIPLRLLEALLRASPRVVPRSELEHLIWGDTPPDSDALRAHMHLVRTAIDRPGQIPLLQTLRGVGYQLAAPP